MFNYLHNQFAANQFLAATVAATLLGAILISIKTAPANLYNYIRRKLVFSAVIYMHESLYTDFETWFYAHYPEKYKNVVATSEERENNNNPEGNQRSKMRTVFFWQDEGVFHVKVNGKYILIKKGKEKLEKAQDLRSLFLNQYHFYSLSGPEPIRQLLENAVRWCYDKQGNNELRIYTNSQFGEWHLSGNIIAKDLKNVIINKLVKAELINDLDKFIASFDVYKQRSIFYKRGFIFTGPPGNGKTSLALTIASYLNRDLYSLDLNSITENDRLRQLFARVEKNVVLVIEDFDCFFDLREPLNKNSEISFSTILNCLDGPFYKEGLITIITTNQIDRIDPALKRAGRMDKTITIPKPGIAEINEYLNVFYEEPNRIPFELTSYNGDLSMCDVQELCMQYEDQPYAAINKLILLKPCLENTPTTKEESSSR